MPLQCNTANRKYREYWRVIFEEIAYNNVKIRLENLRNISNIFIYFIFHMFSINKGVPKNWPN